MIACIRDWMKLDSRNHGWVAWSNQNVMESGFQINKAWLSSRLLDAS